MSDHRAYRIKAGQYDGIFIQVSAETPADAMEKIRILNLEARAEDLQVWGGGRNLGNWSPAEHKDAE